MGSPEKEAQQRLRSLVVMEANRYLVERDEWRERAIGLEQAIGDLEHERDAARAEVERLRQELIEQRLSESLAHESAKAHEAEVERLRGAINMLCLPPGVTDTPRERAEYTIACLREAISERDAARAEVERLRKAARDALRAMESATVFIQSRERIKKPEGHEWWAKKMQALRAALDGEGE